MPNQFIFCHRGLIKLKETITLYNKYNIFHSQPENKDILFLNNCKHIENKKYMEACRARWHNCNTILIAVMPLWPIGLRKLN